MGFCIIILILIIIIIIMTIIIIIITIDLTIAGFGMMPHHEVVDEEVSEFDGLLRDDLRARAQSPTPARKVRKCSAAVTTRCCVRAGSQNGSADLENSVLAHAGGPSSASQSQAAPATPSNVANLLRKILWRHAGSFAFQDIPDELKYVGPGEETAYSQLNQMYEEGELSEFVEAHCEFFECERVGTSMFIRCAGDSAHDSEIGDQSCQSGSGPFWSDSDENIL